jgi:hypothetical protein
MERVLGWDSISGAAWRLAVQLRFNPPLADESATLIDDGTIAA